MAWGCAISSHSHILDLTPSPSDEPTLRRLALLPCRNPNRNSPVLGIPGHTAVAFDPNTICKGHLPNPWLILDDIYRHRSDLQNENFHPDILKPQGKGIAIFFYEITGKMMPGSVVSSSPLTMNNPPFPSTPSLSSDLGFSGFQSCHLLSTA